MMKQIMASSLSNFSVRLLTFIQRVSFASFLSKQSTPLAMLRSAEPGFTDLCATHDLSNP